MICLLAFLLVLALNEGAKPSIFGWRVHSRMHLMLFDVRKGFILATRLLPLLDVARGLRLVLHLLSIVYSQLLAKLLCERTPIL